ncbi:MAG: hypothetical protein LUO79_00825 [Methanomassiliicoccales archaeon]|nr:hypothetical protein [Methanomassiliicoccales archaeon]
MNTKRIREWTDRELVQELAMTTGDDGRDVEREAIRRLVEKVNSLMPREPERS